MTADLFDREGSKQFVTRAYFGGWDTTAMNMVFLGRVNREWGQQYSRFLDGRPGRGVYAGVGGVPIPIQGINTSVDNILQSIGLHKTIDTSAWSMPERPNTAFTASERPERPFTDPGETTINSQALNERSSRSDGVQADPISVDLLLSVAINRQYYATRIRTSVDQKMGKREILGQLFGVKSGATEDWKLASAFYDHVISQRGM